MRLAASFLIGLVFGVGIVISGMANPAKVLNFFDVAGAWDPSLIFVMGGALGVTFIGYRLVWRRRAPLFDSQFHIPARSDVDLRLIGGSALFGVGWGIAGFCPGGALPALGTGIADVFWFVGALIAGMLSTRAVITFAPIRTALQK
ncbi:MAG: YeeE/YedE family protein [Neomegalonema sp.]|nr:YeeE/YedE family protein [Neomegalonema sp.]